MYSMKQTNTILWNILMTIRGLWNIEVLFGIGISDTEPCHTELFLELRKVRNSEKSVHGRLPESWWSLTMLAACSTQISQCFVTWMTQTNLDSELFRGICWITYRTYSKGIFKSCSELYRTWKAIPQTPYDYKEDSNVVFKEWHTTSNVHHSLLSMIGFVTTGVRTLVNLLLASGRKTWKQSRTTLRSILVFGSGPAVWQFDIKQFNFNVY